jgi:hypothetical protein
MTQRKQIRNFWRKMSACVALGGILACAVAQQPDLTVLRVLPAPSDPFTLRVSGRVDVVVQNIGTVASSPCSVVVFTDMNANAQYDAGTDILLGTGSVPAIGANLSATVSVSVLGRVLFWDGWISAYVDYGNAVAESDERNNYGNTGRVCGGSLRSGTLNPRLKWHWGVDNPNNPPRGQYYSDWMNVAMVPAVVDMDGDGYPEVVFAGTNCTGGPCGCDSYLFVLDGRDGRQKYVSPNGVYNIVHSTSPAAGDLDGDGYPVVVFATWDARLLFLKYDPNTSTFNYTVSSDTLEMVPQWASITIANLDQQGDPEIIVGREVFSARGTRLWRGTGTYGYIGCPSPNALVADVDLDGAMEVVAGPTVYNADGTIKYRNTSPPDGYVATANFDNDPQAEIVLVSNGGVYILEHNLSVVRSVAIGDGGFGGPPMIGDADGDGTPEICVASSSCFVVYRADLSILWQATIQDYSSSRTGATLFDFNGDGRPEVVYRDEVYLRIYDGPTGQVRWQVPMSSCTWQEYVQVADVDRDGNADIVACANNNCGFGPQRGIYVYSDPTWWPTRSIWNQHHYCITNVNDDGSIPTTEPPSWLQHNTYRLNPSLNPATPLPDLSVSVPRYCASTPYLLTVRVGNGGAADVTTSFVVAVYDGNPDGGGQIIGQTTLNGLAAGQFVDVTISLSSANPRYVRVDTAAAVVECNERNNTLVAFTGYGADVNRDGIVDNSDLLLVLFDFGEASAHPFYLPTDINCDGQVDDADLLIVLFAFGSSCG